MSCAKSASCVSSTLAYLAALPGNTDSDAKAPTTPTSAMATGIQDAALNAFAFVRLGSTLLFPVSYVRDFTFHSRNNGNRMNTTTNIQVSTLWMLIGGWNHQ